MQFFQFTVVTEHFYSWTKRSTVAFLENRYFLCTVPVKRFLNLIKYEESDPTYVHSTNKPTKNPFQADHVSWKSIHNLYLRNKKNLLEKICRYEKNKKHQTTMFDAPGVHVSI